MRPVSHSIAIKRSDLIKRLWMVVGVLIGIHVLLTVVHYRFHELPWLVRQIFDVDEEDSFPTWYSAMALLLTSVVLATHGWNKASPPTEGRLPWCGLALGFLVLSIDEIAGMHESLNSVTDVTWAAPGAVVGVVVGLIYLKFLWRLPRASAVAFLLGGGIFLGGAIGIEWLTEPFYENDALNTLPYNIWTAVEEGMEMGGVLIFLNAVLKHMAPPGKNLTLNVDLGADS